jgi:hypothetical protein
LLGISAQRVGALQVGGYFGFELGATAFVIGCLSRQAFEILTGRLAAIAGLGRGHPVR